MLECLILDTCQVFEIGTKTICLHVLNAEKPTAHLRTLTGFLIFFIYVKATI